MVSSIIFTLWTAAVLPAAEPEARALKRTCESVLENKGKVGGTNPGLTLRLLQTPQYIKTLPLPGDRLVIRMAKDLSSDTIQLLSPEGQKILADFLVTVDPMAVIAHQAKQFGVSFEAATTMALVDGDFWIRKMFEARNQQNWDEVIRIYESVLQGGWRAVAEAKLQVALALNRRNQKNDRDRALRHTIEVISASHGKMIASEAYGIRARIFKDLYSETKDPTYLRMAIHTYRRGFEANPMDYYPGIAALSLMELLDDESMRREIDPLQIRVQVAIEATLRRYRDKKQAPDYWVISTAMQLHVLRLEWGEAMALLPDLLASAAGPQNISSSLEDYQRLLQKWQGNPQTPTFDLDQLQYIVRTLKVAIHDPSVLGILSEHSVSYVSVQQFADMEGAFLTDPFYVQAEVKASEIASDLREVAKIGTVQMQSFHKFLQTERGVKVKNGPVLLAPTGIYSDVIGAIAEQTGMTPWWEAFPEAKVELHPDNTAQFLERILQAGRKIHLLVPRGFRSRHGESATMKEFLLLLNQFKQFLPQVNFVFGFEQVFPLDYSNRISPTPISSRYREKIVRQFLRAFQTWLVERGDAVKSYSFPSPFNASLYPLIYDQVVEQISAHREVRRLHSQYQRRNQSGVVRILDFGGGTGPVARTLEADDPGRVVEIFDSSRAMTDVALSRGFPESRLHLTPVMPNLRRRDGSKVQTSSVDGVVCNNMIYLMNKLDAYEVVEEAFRILNRGGRFTISSMLQAPPQVHQHFLETVFAETTALEKQGLLPVGATQVLKSSQTPLLNAPNLYSFQEFQAMATHIGFRLIFQQEVNEKAGFFMAFEKP